MLISTAKKILSQRLAGIRPLPEDDVLTELGSEALIYIATRTTPRVLTRDIYIEGDDYSTLRVLEDNMFIVVPDKPIFDIANENYSSTSQLHMDEELSYAVIYYVGYLILLGNEANTRGGTARDKFKEQCEDYIAIFDSNYSRAGRQTYGLI